MPDRGVRGVGILYPAPLTSCPAIDQLGFVTGDSDRVILKDKWMRERAVWHI